MLGNSRRPINIERRVKEDNRIAQFTSYVNEVRKVHVDVLRSNGKDKKRGIDQYKARPVKDMESLLIRKDKLRKKLNQEMNQYKYELSQKGLALENVNMTI